MVRFICHHFIIRHLLAYPPPSPSGDDVIYEQPLTISMVIIMTISTLPVELSCEVVHVVNEKLLSVN